MTTAPERAAAGGDRASPPVAGLDTGARHERDADVLGLALVKALRDAPRTASWRDSLEVTTHFVGSAPRHVALAVTADTDADGFASALRAALVGVLARLPGNPPIALAIGLSRRGPDELLPGAEEAAAAGAARASGRAVHFRGVDELTGELRVAEVIRRSAIDRVQLFTGLDADPHDRLLTRDFVRPLYQRGELVLPTRPAIGHVLVPFEVPNPTPCCADHP